QGADVDHAEGPAGQVDARGDPGPDRVRGGPRGSKAQAVPGRPRAFGALRQGRAACDVKRVPGLKSSEAPESRSSYVRVLADVAPPILAGAARSRLLHAAGRFLPADEPPRPADVPLPPLAGQPFLGQRFPSASATSPPARGRTNAVPFHVAPVARL